MAKEDKENFEEKLARLKTISEQLESGELPLEKAMESFEKGITLSKECYRILDQAEKKVEVLIKENGKVTGKEDLKPMDDDFSA